MAKASWLTMFLGRLRGFRFRVSKEVRILTRLVHLETDGTCRATGSSLPDKLIAVVIVEGVATCVLVAEYHQQHIYHQELWQ